MRTASRPERIEALKSMRSPFPRSLTVAVGQVALLQGSCAVQLRDGAVYVVPYTLVNARDPQIILSGPQAGRRSCDCALVHVDGFDNSIDEARTNFEHIGAAYERSGGLCEMYGFAWRSNPGILFLMRAEREVDERAGLALVRFLSSLEEACPERKISVTAHSLGARVALRALDWRVRNGHRPLESVALVAPAVPLAEVVPGGGLHGGFSGARRLFIVRNSEDYVQGLFYPMLTLGRRSLGQDGLRAALAPMIAAARERGVELIELDLAAVWGPRHSAIANLDERFWAEYFSAGG